jgi:hypothetical protein
LAFIKESTVELRNFSAASALEFYDYLQKDIPSIGKKGLRDYPAASVVIKIKTTFLRALDTEIVCKNPFKNVRLLTTHH